MSATRVIVFGYDELLLASVEVVTTVGGQVVGVVFPSNRSDPRIERVRSAAAEFGAPLFNQPPRSRCGPFAEELRALGPDLILVWSYSMILPQVLLELPRLGCVNVHAGLLPEYRGANGIQWALVNGEAETGVTLHFMDAGLDTGPLIAQGRFAIEPDDDMLTLMRKSKTAGTRVLQACWPQLAAGTAPRVPQDESRARYYPARSTRDSQIDWSASSLRTYNLVRSLVCPFSGAFTSWRGRAVVVRRAVPGMRAAELPPPGTVCRVDEAGLLVATGDGGLLVQELELDGASVRDHFEDVGLVVGERFGD